MRILIITDCYLPSTRSNAPMIHDLALEFREAGHTVAILAPSERARHKYESTIEEGITVVRVSAPTTKGIPWVLRGLREVRLSSTLWRGARHYLQENHSNLVVFYSPSIFLGPLVARLKQRYGCPAYLVLRDIFPQWAIDAGVMRKGELAYCLFRRYERFQYNAADFIGVQSPANYAYFKSDFPCLLPRVEVLNNWTRMAAVALPRRDYRSELKLEKKIVFFYGGNIGIAQDMDNLLRLGMALGNHSFIHFLFVGDGSEWQRIEERIREHKIKNVSLLPSVPQQEYMTMLQQFDVGVISLEKRLSTHNIPGKLLGYGVCGKPVLASSNPGNDLFEIINQNRVGFCLENGNDEGLRAAALELAENHGLRADMGRNCRKLIETKFSARHAVHTILAHFQTAETAGQLSQPLEDNRHRACD